MGQIGLTPEAEHRRLSGETLNALCRAHLSRIEQDSLRVMLFYVSGIGAEPRAGVRQAAARGLSRLWAHATEEERGVLWGDGGILADLGLEGGHDGG